MRRSEGISLASISAYFSSPEGLSALLAAGSTIVASLVVHFIQGKPKVIWFSPNSTQFSLPNTQDPLHPIMINAGQVMVQNLGRKSATEIQITSVPGPSPAGYVLLPNLVHQVETGLQGEWILKIPFIAPSEVITLQILNGPPIDSVRSKDCIATYVPVIHQRVVPRWLQNSIGILSIIGIFSVFRSTWSLLV